MPKLLQISTSANWGAIGRIAEQINALVQEKGWETFFAYGRYVTSSTSHLIKIGGAFDKYEHYAEHRLFDNDGLASRNSTQVLIREIERIQPDIIHLHNIHDHWLNYKLLFDFLNKLNTPIVWTFHDCWAFTGGCTHYKLLNCYRWRDDTCGNNCPIRKAFFMRRLFEKTEKHYQLKKYFFTRTKNLTIVPVSHWLEEVVRESFLRNKKIETIHNGVDICTFKPIDSKEVRRKYGIGDVEYVLGVSGVWNPNKGWEDFIQLSRILPGEVRLVLVGLKKDKIQKAKDAGIIGIPQTDDVNELAAIYSGASVFLNLSQEETFGMTTIEAMACGTPVVVYDSTAVPEPVTSATGFIVPAGDVEGAAKAIQTIIEKGKSHYSLACRIHIEENYNKDDRYQDYLMLYDNLYRKNKCV